MWTIESEQRECHSIFYYFIEEYSMGGVHKLLKFIIIYYIF